MLPYLNQCVLPYQIWSLWSNRMGLDRDPKYFGVLGPRILGWSLAGPRNTTLPTCSIVPNLVVLGQTIRRNCGDVPEKPDLRVPPFKVTQDHWNQHGSIGYLWLPISDPYLWAYLVRFPRQTVISVETCKFSHSEGSHWNLVLPIATNTSGTDSGIQCRLLSGNKYYNSALV